MTEDDLVAYCIAYGKEHGIQELTECLCKTLIVIAEKCGKESIEMECDAGRVEVESWHNE